ncbi:hypothetical protein K9N50_01505 [bacterium]|nr:hypothetical protein [bacterium]
MNDIRFINTIVCVLCAAVMLLSGCADPEGPVGANVGDNGIGGEAKTVEITADKDTCLAFPPAQTGSSPYLYVGSAYGIEASTLIKFHRPVSPFEWTVDTAYIELTVQGGFGAGEIFPRNIAIRQLDMVWTERDTIDKDTIPPGWVFTRIGLDDIDSVWRIPNIPTVDWVTDWLSWIDSSQIDENWTDTTRADSGLTIYLKPQWASGSDLDRLLSFNSRTATEDTTTGRLKPTLYIVITARDSTDGELYTDTLESIASDDMFLLDYDEAVVSDTLQIGSGAVYRSFVHFDLSNIDSVNYYNVINKAVLKLTRFPVVTDLPLTLALKPYNVLDSLSADYRAAEIRNITNASTAIETAVDTLEMTVTNGVSYWMKGSDAAGWLMLMSVAEEINIDRTYLYGSDADSARIPKLTIEYTRYER